ncbi:hypothetical protein Nepgr_012436 [Nepenthes gracilis]|uniref:Uncharacterized protein n=1 Tax=Nepenthes gracilis TaxID=150966 RepID=A0AAD3SFS7_NEPGR|nr:hypothetical protein Nepgr_012436 [Nepenthes gracilis]
MSVDLGLCWSWRVGFDSLYCMLALMPNGSRPALLNVVGSYESLLLCRSYQLNLIYHFDAGVLGPLCLLDVLCCTVVGVSWVLLELLLDDLLGQAAVGATSALGPSVAADDSSSDAAEAGAVIS